MPAERQRPEQGLVSQDRGVETGVVVGETTPRIVITGLEEEAEPVTFLPVEELNRMTLTQALPHFHQVADRRDFLLQALAVYGGSLESGAPFIPSHSSPAEQLAAYEKLGAARQLWLTHKSTLEAYMALLGGRVNELFALQRSRFEHFRQSGGFTDEGAVQALALLTQQEEQVATRLKPPKSQEQEAPSQPQVSDVVYQAPVEQSSKAEVPFQSEARFLYRLPNGRYYLTDDIKEIQFLEKLRGNNDEESVKVTKFDMAEYIVGGTENKHLQAVYVLAKRLHERLPDCGYILETGRGERQGKSFARVYYCMVEMETEERPVNTEQKQMSTQEGLVLAGLIGEQIQYREKKGKVNQYDLDILGQAKGFATTCLVTGECTSPGLDSYEHLRQRVIAVLQAYQSPAVDAFIAAQENEELQALLNELKAWRGRETLLKRLEASGVILPNEYGNLTKLWEGWKQTVSHLSRRSLTPEWQRQRTPKPPLSGVS